MANPSRTRQDSAQPSNGLSSFNGNSVPAPDNSTPVLQHNPGISMDWTAEEQLILEEGITKYSCESNISCYAKIATQLQNKTVRDVALRCRWMTKKELSKRRKEGQNLTRKIKDKKERGTDPSVKSFHFAAQPSFPPYAQGMVTHDNGDGNLYNVIDGDTGKLLQQNAQALQHISANLESLQIQENIGLFCHARDNIVKLLHKLSDMPDMMKQMPPLPVNVNEELASFILPRTIYPLQS